MIKARAREQILGRPPPPRAWPDTGEPGPEQSVRFPNLRRSAVVPGEPLTEEGVSRAQGLACGEAEQRRHPRIDPHLRLPRGAEPTLAATVKSARILSGAALACCLGYR